MAGVPAAAAAVALAGPQPTHHVIGTLHPLGLRALLGTMVRSYANSHALCSMPPSSAKLRQTAGARQDWEHVDNAPTRYTGCAVQQTNS